MKGYCPECGRVVDETEYTQFNGMCGFCHRAENKYYGRGLPLAKDWKGKVDNDG